MKEINKLCFLGNTSAFRNRPGLPEPLENKVFLEEVSTDLHLTNNLSLVYPKSRTYISVICPWCKQPFEATVRAVEHGKKYCSLSCAAKYRNTLKIITPSESPKRLNAIARETWIKRHKQDPECSICGVMPADIHHDDGNRKNNSDENLIPLCRSHHTALENRRNPRRRKEVMCA